MDIKIDMHICNFYYFKIAYKYTFFLSKGEKTAAGLREAAVV